MRRIAVLAVVGALLGAGVPAAVAAAEQDYDSFTVAAGPQNWGRNDARLSSAYRYHLIVTGTSTTAGSDGGSGQFDAQYCFASSSPQCASPFPEDAAIGFGIGKESGGQDEADAIYRSGNFEGISEFGEGRGARATYNGGHAYEQWFTVGDTYANLYAMTWRKYPAGDGVSRTGSFTVTIKRTPISGGGGGGGTPPPSTPVPDTPGGSDSACTAGYRIAEAAGSPIPFPLFCTPEDFAAGAFGLATEARSLDPGETVTLTSPKLGSATRTTVEVRAKDDTVVSVTDPGFRRFARMQCVAATVNPDDLPEDLGLTPADRKLLAEVPFLVTSLFRQRLLACVALVNRMLEAAAAREKAGKLSAAAAAATRCAPLTIPAAYGSASALDRLRVRVKRTPKPNRTLSIRCRRTSNGTALTVATRRPGQKLSSIVGSRLSIGVTRAHNAAGSAPVSAVFRR